MNELVVSRGGRAAGFQLLESLLVCLLIILLCSIAVKGLQGMSAHYRLRHAALAFASELSALRGRAISMNANLSMQVSAEGAAYAMARKAAPSQWHRLPADVRFTSVPRKPVTFFSRGNAAPAGSYVLAGQKGRIKVIVSLMGRVRWEYLGD